MKKIISVPNASRTFEALRSLGYDLKSSIADLVDNSITTKVGASDVSIIFTQKVDKFKFRIIDNGCGMSAAVLEEAMRLGSNTSYVDGDLGKFGMGMKTASLSHCQILTVISKKKNNKITGFRWDINHIKASKEGWVLFKLSEREIDKLLDQEQLNFQSQGTVVLWDELFLLDEELKSCANENLKLNYFHRLEDRLNLHLSMVFHRFLENKNLSLKLNGVALTAWDPFWRSEQHTKEIDLPKNHSSLKIKGYNKAIRIRAFILPNRELFSSEAAWKEAKGLLSWNDSQGYYIYRADRIIRFGGWQGTKAKDEHDKLARISIDIDSKLDQLFRITVNKNKVQFPELLSNHLKNFVNPPVVKKAKAVYNKSKEGKTFTNNFRKQESKLSGISKNILTENGIRTKDTKGIDILVTNPNGSWDSNKISEFFKYGSNKDFEVVSGRIQGGHLWKVVCNVDEKMKVIVNVDHPFYTRIYKNSSNKAITNAVDALMFSLAFAELYNKSNQNAHLFDTFKTVCAKVLEKVTTEEIL